MRLRIAPWLAVLIALPLIAGCEAILAQKPGTLIVRAAHVEADGASRQLELALDCRLSGPMRDALDHGIPITLRIRVAAGRWPSLTRATRRIELRFFPLSRRYQLRQLDNAEVRNFATPAYLVAALASLRIDLPAGFAALPAATQWRVGVALDPAALPGALRLPALFEPAWRLTAEDYAWTVAAR